MILCLSCYRLWPAGSQYCGHCRKSLGRRRCPHGHASPLAARACTTCGSPKLSPGASCLSLGWLPKLLAWGLAGGAAVGALGGIFHATPVGAAERSAGALLGALASLGIFLALAHLVLGDKAKALRPVYKALWKVLAGLLKLMWKLAAGLIGGSKAGKP